MGGCVYDDRWEAHNIRSLTEVEEALPGAGLPLRLVVLHLRLILEDREDPALLLRGRPHRRLRLHLRVPPADEEQPEHVVLDGLHARAVRLDVPQVLEVGVFGGSDGGLELSEFEGEVPGDDLRDGLAVVVA